MLRTLVVLLLMANAGFFAWQQGWLDAALGPAGTLQGREPQRLKLQVHPERLIVLAPEVADDAVGGAGSSQPGDGSAAPPSPPPSSASAAGTGAAGLTSATARSGNISAADAVAASVAASVDTTSCREAGPFTPPEFQQVTALIQQKLPPKSWTSQTVTVQGLWLVYMGPYPDQETYLRKQAELRRIKNVVFEEVRSPATLAMGLALGRYQSEDQANAAIESLKLRGVRTAYVVNVRPTMDYSVVRVPSSTATLDRVMQGLPLPAGKGFSPCTAG